MSGTTNIPSIRTARLVLRAPRETDAPLLHALLQGPGMLRYFPRTDAPTLDQVRSRVASHLGHWALHGFGIWAVEHAASGDYIGRCGLQEIPETGEIEVDYLLGRDHWGRGYTTEAARASVGFGFETVGVETIVGIVHPENAASIRVLEKIGFGSRRRAMYFGMECFRYELTRERFRMVLP